MEDRNNSLLYKIDEGSNSFPIAFLPVAVLIAEVCHFIKE